MTTVKIEWGELPPSQQGRDKNTWFDQFIPALKENPGKWGMIFEGPASEVASKAANIRNNHRDEFDVSTRKDVDNPTQAKLWVSAKDPNAAS